MSVTVRRPDRPVKLEWAEHMFKGTARTIGRLENSPEWFNSALTRALEVAQIRSAMDPGVSERKTWEAYVTAMQIGSAMFVCASSTEETVKCRIDHESRTLPATGPQSFSKASNWLTAFWLAIVCREQERMTQLCNVPIDLLRASGADVDEYIYHWVDTLQSYWLERPGVVGKLTETIELTFPEAAPIAAGDLMDMILYQPINLFHRFFRGDEAGFDQELQKALELHKAYWTEDNREGDIYGMVALGPLAITCLAYDAGFPIEVESEYVPARLLNRSWVGTSDT